MHSYGLEPPIPLGTILSRFKIRLYSTCLKGGYIEEYNGGFSGDTRSSANDLIIGGKGRNLVTPERSRQNVKAHHGRS